MAGLSLDQPLPFAFGILGNIFSFMVYLAPLTTFRRVYRKKSTEGFQSLPYVAALFSAVLWIYYALLKGYNDTILLITINATGCFIESIYVVMYLIYAPRAARIYTAKIMFLLNIATLGLIVLLSLLLSKGHTRVDVLGVICVAFSVCVYIAPLSIIRLVIRTRSVEFMPLSLSLSLTLSAFVWFFYGYLTHDRYVAIPNVIGFGFGVIQMGLYVFYKYARPSVIAVELNCVPEHVVAIPRPCTEVHPTGCVDGGDKGDVQADAEAEAVAGTA